MFESLRYDLKHNRKSVLRKAAAWLLFGLIIIVMGAFGINKSSQQGMGQGTAATVNGEAVPMARLQEAMERLRRDPRMAQYEALGGEFGQKMLQSQALSQVVEMELIKQKANKEHITVSDAEVADTIMKFPALQSNGQFDRNLYRQFLESSGKTSGEFEADIRTQLALQKTAEIFRTALMPTAAELQLEKSLTDRKADVEFLKVSNDSLVPVDSISNAKVSEWLAKPENEKKVKDYYDSHKKEYSQEEQVKARHILIKAVEGDKESENKAFAKAQDLEKQLKAGADFAALAKKNSDDPGSKDKGGDLGFFSKGSMVAAFEKAAFDAKPGEVTSPVKTQYGYHIIQTLEKKPAATQTFDQVKTQIARTILARDESHEQVANLEKALKTPDALAAVSKIAAEHKLKWEDAGSFDLTADAVPKVGDGDEAVRTAFMLTPQKPIADHLIHQGPNAYVLRYKAPVAEAKKKSAEPNPHDQPDAVAALAANRRSEDALRQWVESMRKSAKIVTSDGVGPGGGGGSPFDDE